MAHKATGLELRDIESVSVPKDERQSQVLQHHIFRARRVALAAHYDSQHHSLEYHTPYSPVSAASYFFSAFYYNLILSTSVILLVWQILVLIS